MINSLEKQPKIIGEQSDQFDDDQAKNDGLNNNHFPQLVAWGEGAIGQISRCQWELQALSEFEEYDRALSEKLLFKISSILTKYNVSDGVVSVGDKYHDEHEPHYQLIMSFGNNIEQAETITFLYGYSSAAEGKIFNGFVIIKISLADDVAETANDILTEIFIEYDSLMAEFYSDWITQYDQTGYQLF